LLMGDFAERGQCRLLVATLFGEQCQTLGNLRVVRYQ
jgi:hypothetical protein